MKHINTVTLVVLMGLSCAVLATEPPTAATTAGRSVAASSCRNVSDLKGKIHSYCGSAAQWVEFDSKMAKLDQGFSCRPNEGSQLCLFARQWDYMDRNYAQQRGTQNFIDRMYALRGIVTSDGAGAEVGRLSAMSIDSNPVGR